MIGSQQFNVIQMGAIADEIAESLSRLASRAQSYYPKVVGLIDMAREYVLEVSHALADKDNEIRREK